MTNTALNRTSILQLINRSGVDVAQGDTVVLSINYAESFETITTSGYLLSTIGVVIEPLGITHSGTGGIAVYGWVPKLNLDTSANIGDFVKTSTTETKATPANTYADEGVFAQTLEGGTSPKALILSK